MVFVYDKATGLAVAVDLDDPVSHYASELTTDAQGHTLTFRVRMAVAPGRKDRVTLAFNYLPALYGYRNAYQWLYDTHPFMLSGRDTIDPRFYLGSALPPDYNARRDFKASDPVRS